MHRRRVASIDQQVESTQTFQSDNLAISQRCNCGSNRFIGSSHHLAAWIPKFSSRPTLGAGDWLCVKTPVSRGLVLSLAVGAHLERGHSGIRAVVGQALDYAVARAAVSAIDEGVAIAPVGRVEHFAETFRADRDVGQDNGGFAPAFSRFADFKRGEIERGEFAGFDADDPSERGRFGWQPELEFGNRPSRPFYFDEHSLWSIIDPASQMQFVGKAIDERTKSDPLYGSAHSDLEPGFLPV